MAVFSTTNVVNNLPELGSSSQAALSPQKEKELGEEFIRQIRNEADVLYDPLLADYLNDIGQKLASHGAPASQVFEFFWVNSQSINAFAGPGGYIGINTGLLLKTETESELAGVVAHEIAHVTQNHIARRFELMGQLNIPTLAALLASIAIASQAPEAGTAGVAATLAGAAQLTVNEIRQNEKEADRVGISTLQAAGFDPKGMPNFFHKMQTVSRFYKSELPELLRTHPLTESRLADALNRAEQFEATDQKPASEDYQLMKARAKALTIKDTYLELSQTKSQRDKISSPSPADDYYYALLLLRNHQLEKALEISLHLSKQYPDSLAFQLLHSEVLEELGQLTTSLQIVEALHQTNSQQHSVIMRLSTLLLKDNQAKKARNLLLAHARKHPDNPSVIAKLAQAQTSAGFKAETYLARAHYHYLLGELDTAIKQARFAIKQKDAAKATHALARKKLQEYRQEKAEKESFFGLSR